MCLEGDWCYRRYDDQRGTCRKLRECPKAREEFKLGVPLTFCAYLGQEPVLCCVKADDQFEESIYEKPLPGKNLFS